MRVLLSALAISALVSALPAHASAQTELDHRVQRAWDNAFDPPPPGDRRTNWERRRDNSRRAEAAEFCRYHPEARGCYRR